MLVNQTMVNDFGPFGRAMAKLSTDSKVIEREDGTEVALPIAIDKHRRIDTSYEIYLGLYQAITGPAAEGDRGPVSDRLLPRHRARRTHAPGAR